MATLREIRKIWDGIFVEIAHARGLRTVGGYGYVDDGTYVSTLAIAIGAKSDPLAVTRFAEIKPIALDDVLWGAFMPELNIAPGKRRSLRVNGVFAAPGLELFWDNKSVGLEADPTPTIVDAVDEFLLRRAAFRQAAPSPIDFIDQVVARVPNEESSRPKARLREVLALIVAGHDGEALTMLERLLIQGERGPMGGPDGDVFHVLAKHLANTSRSST